MKNLLIRVVKYLPISIVLVITGYMMFSSPFKSVEQFAWFSVYSAFATSYRTWVEEAEELLAMWIS